MIPRVDRPYSNRYDVLPYWHSGDLSGNRGGPVLKKPVFWESNSGLFITQDLPNSNGSKFTN